MDDDHGDDKHSKKPRVIGNYRIGKVLGTGSYGYVRLGTNVVTGEQIAIKTLKDAHNRKGIQREISILKLLDHPNIVKLYDVLEDTKVGTFYLILELATGGELFDYIVARGKLKEKEARKFFRQIVSGVEYCHSNLVIHRDLKPENLLLDSDGNIKINDFGFSNVMVPGERFSTFCGSVSYVAPEIIKNIKYVGPEIDIWSMGVILYTLVCGRLPWPETSDGSPAISNIIEGDYDKTPLQPLSPGVQSLLARILVPDPQRRATMAEIRNHPWVNEGWPNPPPCLVQDFPPVLSPNEEVLNQMIHIGFDERELRVKLAKNERCPELTTYHLLLKKWHSHQRAALGLSPVINNRAVDMAELQAGRRRTSSVSKPSKEESPPARSPALPAAPVAKVGSGAAKRFHNKRASRRMSYNVTSAYGEGYTTQIEGIAAALSPQEQSREASHSNHTATPSITIDNSNISETDNTNNTKQSAPTKTSIFASRRHTVAPSGHQGLQTSLTALTEKETSSTSRGRPLSILQPKESNQGANKVPYSSSPKRRSIMLNVAGSLESAFKSLMKQEKLKEVKGVFNVDTTTTEPPERVVEEVKKVLDIEASQNNDFVMKYKQKGYVFKCEYPNQRLKFELEICKIKSLSLTGIKSKRMKGDLWVYKEYCQRLMSKMKL